MMIFAAIGIAVVVALALLGLYVTAVGLVLLWSVD